MKSWITRNSFSETPSPLRAPPDFSFPAIQAPAHSAKPVSAQSPQPAAGKPHETGDESIHGYGPPRTREQSGQHRDGSGAFHSAPELRRRNRHQLAARPVPGSAPG